MRRLTLSLFVLFLGTAGALLDASPPSAAKPGGLSKSARIDGSEGGSLRLGRFRVDVPPGAYSGRATITIHIVDPAAKVCELDVQPASANRFRVPVVLTAGVADADFPQQARLSLLRYDEQRQRWDPVPGSTLDAGKQEISAPLEHFSIYGLGDPLLGRSGW